jgi:hypothetical protein
MTDKETHPEPHDGTDAHMAADLADDDTAGAPVATTAAAEELPEPEEQNTGEAGADQEPAVPPVAAAAATEAADDAAPPNMAEAAARAAAPEPLVPLEVEEEGALAIPEAAFEKPKTTQGGINYWGGGDDGTFGPSKDQWFPLEIRSATTVFMCTLARARC